MEPRGRNRWQRIANPTASDTAETAKSVAVGCDRLPQGPHGKERVLPRLPTECVVPLSENEGVDVPPSTRGLRLVLTAAVRAWALLPSASRAYRKNHEDDVIAADDVLGPAPSEARHPYRAAGAARRRTLSTASLRARPISTMPASA